MAYLPTHHSWSVHYLEGYHRLENKLFVINTIETNEYYFSGLVAMLDTPMQGLEHYDGNYSIAVLMM